MLSKTQILRLTNAGVLTAKTVEFRVQDGRFIYRHATKGMRSRSVRSLQMLGLL